MPKNKGYFTLQRDLLESKLWLGEPFTRGQAWADLIGRANFEDSETWIDGRAVLVPRGSLQTTFGELAARWKWSRRKTWEFIKELERVQMAVSKRNARGTLITIENYDKYQLRGNALRNDDGTPAERSRNDGGMSTIIKRNSINKEGENARASARPPRNITKNPDGSYTEILPTGESVLYPPWAPPESFEEEG